MSLLACQCFGQTMYMLHSLLFRAAIFTTRRASKSNTMQADHIVTAILVLLLAGDSLQSKIDHDDMFHEYGRIISQPISGSGQSTQIVYKSLCNTIEKKVQLEDEDYEFEPSHYIETTCTKTGSAGRDLTREENRQMCNIPGFDCVQQHKEVTILRRLKNQRSEGWEPFLQTVPTHCECMWPKLE